jgi:hypothetical protein
MRGSGITPVFVAFYENCSLLGPRRGKELLFQAIHDGIRLAK